MKHRGKQYLLFLILSLMLSGCIRSTGRVHLYSLAVMPPPSPEEHARSFFPMTVLLPVHLPQRLDRKGMYTRPSPEKAVVSVSHLWSAPLGVQLTATLGDNISQLLNTSSIVVSPGPRYATFHYSIEVDIQEFSPLNDTFVLRSVWTVNNVSENSIWKRAAFSATFPTTAGDYSAHAVAASMAVEQLSREIALYLSSIDSFSAERHQP